MASSGDVVESPNYPHKYSPLSNCKWTLEGPQGHNILLQVQFRKIFMIFKHFSIGSINILKVENILLFLKVKRVFICLINK